MVSIRLLESKGDFPKVVPFEVGGDLCNEGFPRRFGTLTTSRSSISPKKHISLVLAVS